MIRHLKISITGESHTHESVRSRLLKLPGLEQASISNNIVSARYELPHTDAATIVGLLTAGGLSLTLSFSERLGLWLRYYQEAIFLENSDDEAGWDSYVREIYVSRYRHRRHGRRDDRPRHWRKYSAPTTHD
jgi:hypothetical protein